MSFKLGKAVNPERVFIARWSEFTDRFDPEMVRYRRRTRAFRYPLSSIRSLLAEGAQYGAGERGLDRLSVSEPRYIRITDIDEFGMLQTGLGATAEQAEAQYFLADGDLLLARSGNTVGKAYLRRGRLTLPDKNALRLSRIDGNHRLSVVSKDPAFREINAPFCLVLFRSAKEAARNSRVLFHNINYKQQPLSMEENLRLILDDQHDIFPDADLKNDPPFGWPYYLARQLHRKNLDLDLLPHLRPLIEPEPRTFLVETLTALHAAGLLKDNEGAIAKFKGAMQRAHSLFESHPALQKATNPGLLGALVHYEIKGSPKADVFVRWVLANQLHKIGRSDAAELIKIFDQVLLSRGRKIFVSMPYGKDETNNHWETIVRICTEVSKEAKFDLPLVPERVDLFKDGTSYNITDKIWEMITDCGLLIGNLTYGNANVYHEIGYMMGQSHAHGGPTARLLLILDDSVKRTAKKVFFNLQGLSQLRFKGSEDLGKKLKKQLASFFTETKS